MRVVRMKHTLSPLHSPKTHTRGPALRRCVPQPQALYAQELEPRERRGLVVCIAAGRTITVAIAITFRIPLAAYMAYIRMSRAIIGASNSLRV
jgi:hypothetical protein